MAAAIYDVPIALVLVISGVLSCFAGYRLFRTVLAISGFVIGWSLTGTFVSVHSTAMAFLVALVGGIAGALALVFAYFVAVALIGASLGAVVAHVVSSLTSIADPPWPLLVLLVVLGAIGAILLQRYVIVVWTAFVGAWTIIIAALAAAGNRGAQAAVESHNWILSPLATAAIAAWVPIAWLALGLLGTTVQLGVTGRRKNSRAKG